METGIEKTEKKVTKSDIQKRAMVEALEQSLGIVTNACRAVGITRKTHYEWLKLDEDYRNRVNDISEMALDFVESQLYKQIKEGEISPTIFFLKTKGKSRGYIERIEQEHSGGMENKLEIVIVDSGAPLRTRESDIDLD